MIPPTLLLIFNRPEKTRRVMEALSRVRPPLLFVAADGPRPDRPQDVDDCARARSAATEAGWPCELRTRFLEENQGCDPAVASGLEWFFSQVEYGIVLEDDCVPHPDFFTFCAELFDRYADDERIMQISGLAPYPLRRHPHSYHFSRAFRCGGGWGTWRRAWSHFRFSADPYPEEETREMLKLYFPTAAARQRAYLQYQGFKSGSCRNWDFIWNLACYAQHGLSIVPEHNLVSNIGYGEDATHTRAVEPQFSHLETHPAGFPLSHPPFVYADGRPERALERALYRGLPWKSRLSRQLRHAAGSLRDFFDNLP